MLQVLLLAYVSCMNVMETTVTFYYSAVKNKLLKLCRYICHSLHIYPTSLTFAF